MTAAASGTRAGRAASGGGYGTDGQRDPGDAVAEHPAPGTIHRALSRELTSAQQEPVEPPARHEKPR